MATFIIPGAFGSDSEHWQSWMENQLDDAVRIHQEHWNKPCLPVWSEKLTQALDQSPEPVWLIAHSFGCLVSVVAAMANPEKVAGALFVAPADPIRFSAKGFLDMDPAHENVENLLPRHTLPFPAVVVASENDPWVKLTTAAYWAHIWGCLFVSVGRAGHINVRSGFGPWPWGLQLYRRFRASHDSAYHYDGEDQKNNAEPGQETPAIVVPKNASMPDSAY